MLHKHRCYYHNCIAIASVVYTDHIIWYYLQRILYSKNFNVTVKNFDSLAIADQFTTFLCMSYTIFFLNTVRGLQLGISKFEFQILNVLLEYIKYR